MWNARRLSAVAGVGIAVLSLLACGTPSEMSPGEPVAPLPPPTGTGTAGSLPIAPPSIVPDTAGAGGSTLVVEGGTGGSNVPVPTAGSGAAGTAGTAGAAGEMAAYRAAISVPQVAGGEEGTVCIQVRLDNAAPIEVVRLHNKLSPASHHFIVSKVTDPAGAEEPLTPCTPFRGAIRGAPLTITQKHDDDIVLPAGVSYHFGASQILHLELHYLNVEAEPVDVMAETELFLSPAGVASQEATVMLIGTADILVAPGTTGDTGPKYTALPEGMDGVHFFAITGHTHRLGTSVEVSSAAGPDQTGPLLYSPQPFIWDAPEMQHLEPAIEVPTGGGFSFRCTWNNPTPDAIGFGESALAEMCFFWAYYYPKKPVTNVLLDGADLSVLLGI